MMLRSSIEMNYFLIGKLKPQMVKESYYAQMIDYYEPILIQSIVCSLDYTILFAISSITMFILCVMQYEDSEYFSFFLTLTTVVVKWS
jgi:hypothetical protein